MKNQNQTVSEVKDSSRTRTLAHETRKNRQSLAMFVMTVANQDGAMEADSISKNERGLKSLTSKRKNRKNNSQLKKVFLIAPAIVFCLPAIAQSMPSDNPALFIHLPFFALFAFILGDIEPLQALFVVLIPGVITGIFLFSKTGFGLYFNCWKQYANFSGRARRKEYWVFHLSYFFVILVCAGVGVISATISSDKEIGLIVAGILVGLYFLATLIPSLSVTVRRLHDTNKSGLWLLLLLIYIVGFPIILVFTLLNSDPKTNKWGTNPKLGIRQQSNQNEEVKNCPYCGEEVLAAAKKCKHCGEWIKTNK